VLISGRDQEHIRRDRIAAISFASLARKEATRPKLQTRVKSPLVRIQSGRREGVDPLYLFACATLWHSTADAGAGWELV
jgi:hypothetical protein